MAGLVLGACDMSKSPLMLLSCPPPLSMVTLQLEVTVKEGQRARTRHLFWPPIVPWPSRSSAPIHSGTEMRERGGERRKEKLKQSKREQKKAPTLQSPPLPLVGFPSVSSGERVGREMQTIPLA